MSNIWNTCRLCKDTGISRPLLRYGIRHYCHAECGFAKWGDEFLNKIPAHEIGSIPCNTLIGNPVRMAIAKKLYPDCSPVLDAVQKGLL